MIESIIYIAGFTAILALLCLVTLVLAWVFFKLANYKMQQVLRFARYSTIDYYVTRMEKEGLKAVQSEYRKMVKDRQPYLLRDFVKLDQEITKKEREVK